VRKALLALTSVLFAAGTIGTNIGPALVDERPLLVLLLSARNRNLIGSIPYVDALTFFTVGFARLLIAAVALYFVGRWFGERALRWTESQVGELPAIYHWTERATARAGWAAVLIAPGSNIVCLLVGHMKMPPKKFLALASAGIAVRLVVLWFGGKAVESEIESAVNWINNYQWWIVGGLFGVSFLQSSRRSSPGPPDADQPETDLPGADEPDPNGSARP
jgi:membrane protein DedA with SNARE-associated domain